MAMDRQNEEEVLISVQDILYVLKSNLIGIVLLAIIGGAVFGAYSKFMIAPKYKAEARMYVLSGEASSLLTLSRLEMSTQLASDYVEMMLSRPMLEEVISSLSLEGRFTTGSLANCISINNPTDTRILNVTVTSTDAALAADIANTLAEISAVKISEVMETAAPKVFQKAVISNRKVSPSNSKNTLMGMIMGAFIAIAFAMFMFITDDTIKSEEDIERYAELASFGVINGEPSKNAKKYGSYGRSYGKGY